MSVATCSFPVHNAATALSKHNPQLPNDFHFRLCFLLFFLSLPLHSFGNSSLFSRCSTSVPHRENINRRSGMPVSQFRPSDLDNRIPLPPPLFSQFESRRPLPSTYLEGTAAALYPQQDRPMHPHHSENQQPVDMSLSRTSLCWMTSFHLPFVCISFFCLG